MLRSSAAILVGTLPLSAGAAGVDDEIGLALEAGYASYSVGGRHHGLFGGLDAQYAFAPFWAARAGYLFGAHDSKGDTFRVHQLGAGMRFRLDVFEYVPWIELSPTALLGTGGDGPAAFDAGVSAGLGLDRLVDESWAVGIAARYFRLFREEHFPAYLTAGFRVEFRWAPGDPFAP